jgi:hypothetical protein
MRFFDEPDTVPVGPMPVPANVNEADEIKSFADVLRGRRPSDESIGDSDPTPAPPTRTRRATKAQLSESQIAGLDDGPTSASVIMKARDWLVRTISKPSVAEMFVEELTELAANIETAEARERLISGAEAIGLELTPRDTELEIYPGATADLHESTDDARRFAANLR